MTLDQVRMTLGQVQHELMAKGIRLDHMQGEYRVRFTLPECQARGIDRNATAYYTDDMRDAYQTGLAMAAR